MVADDPMGPLVGRVGASDTGLFGSDVEVHLHRLLMIDALPTLLGHRQTALIVALAVAVAALLTADWAAAHRFANVVPRLVMRHIDAAPRVVDVLGIGNS